MGTNPVYCYEYAPANILVRAQTHQIQILQNGTEVASIRFHMNSQVSFSRTGRMVYDSGGGSYLLDFNASFPQEPVCWKRESRVALTPDGTRIIHYAPERFPFKDAEGQKHVGVIAIDVETDAVEPLWQGDTTQPREIYPFGEARYLEFSEDKRNRWDPVTTPLEFPEIIVGADSQTWALLKKDRVEIGRGTERLASVYWHGFSFYPEMGVFDAACERFILSGTPGIVALGLDGTPLAHWEAILPCTPYEKYGRTITTQDAPVISPVAFWGDDLLAVARVAEEKSYSPKQRWYEVLRFDPHTLELRGPLDALPRRRDPDGEAALLPLADGSLAWMMRNMPVLIAPSEQNTRRSTEWMIVIGDEPKPAVPHPSADWYNRGVGESGCIPGKLSDITHEQRISLARSLLNELTKDGRFDELVLFDPDAFAPYRETVLNWTNARLKMLKTMSPRRYWRIMAGAPDEAVDAFAQKLEKKLPACNDIRVMLLIGCDTPRALEHLGNLGRQSEKVADVCRRHLLAIPENGPAIRRFTPRFLEIIASMHRDPDAQCRHDAGLETAAPSDRVFAEGHGLTCAAPLRHLLTAVLPDTLFSDSALACQQWFISPCAECDESLYDYAYRVPKEPDGQIALLGALDDQGRLSTKPVGLTCEGEFEDAGPEPGLQLTLEPYSPDEPPRQRGIRRKHVGRLGGQPEWWQAPRIPDCPECGRMMLYTGFITADDLYGDVPDIALYAFQCEQCGIGVQIGQMT